jgi:RND family efflux transporter MFP subunit
MVERTMATVMTRRTGWLGLGLGVGLAAAAGASACGASPRAAEPPAGEPIAVTLTRVVAVDATERIEAGGIVSARDTALVASRLVAPIATVRVRAGDHVNAGDVLITLDARDVDALARQSGAAAVAAERALAQARLGQAAADADQRLAEAYRTRIAALHARRAATDQERDEADARLAVASARRDGAATGRELADAQLDAARASATAGLVTASFATLRAPFRGVVTERLADPGTLAAPGQPLLRVEASGPRQVQARVDAARAATVRPGQRVEVLVDGSDAGSPPARVDGVVTEIARAVAADPSAFTVTVALPPAVTARSGTFARVRFDATPRRALRIPASAIRRHGQVTSVFVVQDRRARLRLVHLGEASPGGVDVLAGLDAGEAIVAAPPPRLADGVAVVAASAPPAGVAP